MAVHFIVHYKGQKVKILSLNVGYYPPMELAFYVKSFHLKLKNFHDLMSV